MSEQTNSAKRPSALGAFVRGAASGLMSGLVMAGIIAVITPLFVSGMTIGAAFIASGPIMMLASTLFGGVMATQRAIFNKPQAAHGAGHIVPIPVPGMGGPTMVPSMDMAVEAEQAPTKSWVAQTGRSEGSRGAIDQILSTGSMSDKDRAAAILASRDASADQHAGRA